MDRQHTNPGGVLAEEFMKPLGLSARALGAAIGVPGNRVSDIMRGKREMTEDEDVDAPTIEELKILATLLWDAYPRTRLKGKKGEALHELSEIRAQIVTDRSLPLKKYVWAIAYGL